MLARNLRPSDAGDTDVYSAEAKSEDTPEWSDTASDTTDYREPSWQGREEASSSEAPFERDTRETQYESEPASYDYYSDTGVEGEEVHPPALARLGPPAGFGRRLVAFLIDNTIVFMVLGLLFPIVLGRPYLDFDGITEDIQMARTQIAELPTATPVLGNDADEEIRAASSSDDAESLGSLLAGSLLAILIGAIYNGLLIGIWGTTLGKRILNVYVLDRNGQIIGVPLGIGRALATTLSSIILYVGYMLVLFRRDNRALHDLLVGTYPITLTSQERLRTQDQDPAE